MPLIKIESKVTFAPNVKPDANATSENQFPIKEKTPWNEKPEIHSISWHLLSKHLCKSQIKSEEFQSVTVQKIYRLNARPIKGYCFTHRSRSMTFSIFANYFNFFPKASLSRTEKDFPRSFP